MTAPFTEQQRQQHRQNHQARISALGALSRPQNLAAPSVSYEAGGHLLIIGADDLTRLAACELLTQSETGVISIKADSGVQSISLLITDAVQNPGNEALEQALTKTEMLPVAYGKLNELNGYLGEFQAWIKPTSTDSANTLNRASTDSIDAMDLAPALIHRSHFDLVLDLGREPALSQELSPPGYFTVGNDSHLSLSAVLAELPNYDGEFEKPLYFRINNDICAHAGRGKTGCTRCLDVCPADAISSINSQIEVDSYLCHGAGSCSTACPTGAISYGMPKAEMMADYLTRLLAHYREQGGEQPVIMFHADEQEVTTDQLASNIIPVALEEIATVGMELWMHAFNEGVSRIIFLTSDSDEHRTPISLIQLLERETKLGNQILAAMGYGNNSLSLCGEITGLTEEKQAATEANGIQVASAPATAYQTETFAEAPSKRQRLIHNINRLQQMAPAGSEKAEQILMPASAPFGQVSIDSDACTLCFSCANICPTNALQTGKEAPAILLTEMDCVQCGLCESACPENAISREQRFIFNTDLRDNPRTLHKDEAFCCLDCGKPFAPTSTVNKMKEKLKGHAMFAGEALRRLELCEDCRVKDIYRGLAADPQAQLNL
ncbi:4Fe-4S binding protein [Oceanospirillum sp.]|uniref:4Fe-4S binding protein n=1 Tax=Oceanospirillum sp. TaxID=2021254 RepID=UPI003A930896